MAKPGPTVPDEERLTAPLRVNLLPTEYAQLQAIAEEESNTVAGVARRAVRELLRRYEQAQLPVR